MINHVRTLLLNASAASFDKSAPGSEFIPDEYTPVRLPVSLLGLRRSLFGSNPDATGLNYRLRQFMPLLHGTDVVQYTLAQDPRVTYITDDSSLFYAKYGLSVYPRDSDAVFSVQYPPFYDRSTSNRLRQVWNGTIVASPSPGSLPLGSIEVTAAPGSETSLPGLPQATVTLQSGGSVGDTFQVQMLSRPAVDIGLLPGIVRNQSFDLDLFGPAPSGPFIQFREWWMQSENLHFQLSGLLLALAYRTDLLRQGR